MVGDSQFSSFSSYYHSFVWTDANGNGVRDGNEMEDLGTVSGGTLEVLGYGINDSGQVVGRMAMKTGSYAYLWQRNASGVGVFIDLNTLKAGGETGLSLFLARKINNAPRPQIIARGNTKNAPSFATLLTPL